MPSPASVCSALAYAFLTFQHCCHICKSEMEQLALLSKFIYIP